MVRSRYHFGDSNPKWSAEEQVTTPLNLAGNTTRICGGPLGKSQEDATKLISPPGNANPEHYLTNCFLIIL